MKTNLNSQKKGNKLSGYMFLAMCTGMVPGRF